MFGRPPRDTGLESERNNHVSADQRLHLLNASHILKKIDQSRLVMSQAQSRKSPREIASAMYIQALSRYPTAEETAIVENYFRSSGLNQRQACADVLWALINNPEFFYRH